MLYVGPAISNAEEPTIECNPPSQLVLSQLILPEPTMVTLPPKATSFEATFTKFAVITGENKEETTHWQSPVSRIASSKTITIPPLTTKAVEFWDKRHGTKFSTTGLIYTYLVNMNPFNNTSRYNKRFQPRR